VANKGTGTAEYIAVAGALFNVIRRWCLWVFGCPLTLLRGIRDDNF